MLGRLQMTTEQALQHYSTLVQTVYHQDNKKPIYSLSEGTFKSTAFVSAMKKIISSGGSQYTGDENMIDDGIKGNSRV